MLKRFSESVCLLFLIVVFLTSGGGSVASASAESRMSVLSVKSVEELISHYERRQYTLKDIQDGHHLIVEELPNNFDSIADVDLRKTLFQRIVLPLIYVENQRIASEREQFKQLRRKWQDRTDSSDTAELSAEELKFVRYLVDRYNLDDDFSGEKLNPSLIQALDRRINTIPPSLVLAQATNESGWGTSRFAIKGNNLFGVRSYDESTPGFKPKGVPDTSSFRVRKFPTLLDSVRNYMRTLNTHWAYEEFRTLRTKHTADRPLKLVQGLSRYSERRQEYMDRLVSLIKGNNYRRFDR